jgi:hypothetical protein
MSEWLKAVFMIVGLGGWLATVVVTLMRDGIPDATTLGIPAALVIALAPPFRISRSRGSDQEETPTEAETSP